MIYDVRFARKDEIGLVVHFLEQYWNPNHILVKSRKIMDFQHKLDDCDDYSIVIGYNTETKEIDGVFCVIYMSKYDPSLYKNGNYWSALLKVRDDVVNPDIKHLVFDFILFIYNLPNFKSFGAISLSQMAQKVMNQMFDVSGVMKHYYIANNTIKTFEIGRNLTIKEVNKNDECSIREINLSEVKDVPKSVYYPQKSLSFLINRFLDHPYYHYSFWGIFRDSKLICIWVTRKISIGGNMIIRIVDVLGNLSEVGFVGNSIQFILERETAEYVDFLNFGLDVSIFSKMGFEEVDPFQDDIIVPNYFEPFEKRNVPIYFSVITENPYVIFKADGDQDRPSIIPNE